jgi:hypothetical protein
MEATLHITAGLRSESAYDARAVRAALGFSLAMAVFLITPAFIDGPFPPYTLLKWGDILDVATAVVILPAAWLLLKYAGRDAPGAGVTLGFVALAGLWASAQGMHLAANAIGHVVPDGSKSLVAALSYDLDEVISHYLWHAALVGWTVLFAWRSLADRPDWNPMKLATAGGLVVAAVVFGFTFFVIVVEGQTAPLGLPGAAAVMLIALAAAGRTITRRPIAAMLVGGYAVALVLCLIWAGMNDWQLIEFSKAGIIS